MKYYRKRHDPRKPYFIAALIVLSMLLVLFLYTNRQQERRRSADIHALQEEAAPYEQEIRKIQSDLQEQKNMIHTSSDVSGVIPCFIPASADDLSLIKRLADDHNFTPSIVLDCARDTADLKPIVKAAANENFGILLMSSTFNDSVLDTADSMKQAAAEYGFAYTPAFLLLRNNDSETARTQLAERGYENLFLYSDDLMDGSLDEILYLPYGYFRSTTSGSSLANTLASAHTSMAVLFDLSAASTSGSQLTEQTISDGLTLFDNRMDKKDLEYRDIPAAFSSLAKKENMADRAQEEYDRYSEAQENRIQELRSTIDEIYSHWNSEK